MDFVALVGRLAFSVMFVSSGINHLRKRQYMTEYAKQMGVPKAEVVVPASGVMIIAGAFMVALGLLGDLGALLLALFLVPTAIYMHGFWKFEDDQMRQQQQIHFMKNMTMAGGAFALFALFLCAELGLTMTGPLFG